MMRRLFLLSTTAFWLAVAYVFAASLGGVSEAEVPAKAARPATFTLAEIARHASAADCWMAIDGQVYDFSRYLPKHPSEPAVITVWCGREASEAYRTKTKGRPHSAYASELMAEYRIGQLAATR